MSSRTYKILWRILITLNLDDDKLLWPGRPASSLPPIDASEWSIPPPGFTLLGTEEETGDSFWAQVDLSHTATLSTII